MKKMMTAILVFDLMAGLLFLGFWEKEGAGTAAADGREVSGSVVNGNTAGENGINGNAAGGNVVNGNAAGENGVNRNAAGGNAVNGREARAAEDVKRIAITFDDGPHPNYTGQLLDGLKERGVHATFFVTGEHAELHPDVIKRMQEEGHLIGNHTYSHIQLRKNNREEFRDELIKTNEILKEITGEEVQYVRPPYGSWDKSFEKELNMFPVLWNVDPLDWCSGNVSCIVEKIVSKTGENDIILMHDYYDTSVTAALEAIDELMEEGYTFVTVEEFFRD